MTDTHVRKSRSGRCFWMIAGAIWLSLQTFAPAQDQPAAPADAPADGAAASTVTVPAHRFAKNVVVIPIRGAIDQVTVRSVERRMAEAMNIGADAVVFELDTPGGLGDAALKICNIIKSSPISNTVAWIHPDAYSAGTFIALACKEVVMSPYATIGDVAPILPGLIPIPPAERAKIESPFLAEIVDSARRNGYDEKLVMSFVAVDIELWLVQNKDTGDYLFVDRSEYLTLFGEEPKETARAGASGGLPPPGKVVPFIGGGADSENAAEPMTPEDRDREVEMMQSLPSQRPAISEADRGDYRFVEAVVDKHTLLVLKTDKAIRYGLAVKTVANDAELTAFFGASTLTRLEQNWSESLVQLMTSMPVRLGLIVIFAIGLLWEMATPGVGVPGSIAIVALLALLGAPLLTGLAQWWSIAFVLFGLALIAAEVFLIPGFGIAGIGGLILLGIGFVGTFVAPDPGGGFFPTSPQGREALTRGVAMLLLAAFASAVALYFVTRHLGVVPGLNRLILANTLANEDHANPSLLEAMAPGDAAGPAVGDVGVAMTDLRPVGRARISGRVYDVVSGRGVIESQSPIRVTSADRFRVVVEIDTDVA